ncbi:hypothetical protein [Pseudovibrio denitrificans]|uniref:hypothetical protein n=1 Tax=Pseudovibrio denitrificans TaxID=258256 RepID=UPI0013E2B0CC|nr:hypothetical protein [Pseudovibrio denitrificans]
MNRPDVNIKNISVIRVIEVQLARGIPKIDAWNIQYARGLRSFTFRGTDIDGKLAMIATSNSITKPDPIG